MTIKARLLGDDVAYRTEAGETGIVTRSRFEAWVQREGAKVEWLRDESR